MQACPFGTFGTSQKYIRVLMILQRFRLSLALDCKKFPATAVAFGGDAITTGRCPVLCYLRLSACGVALSF